MKILTLNVHSLMEENCEQKFVWFLETALMEQPDLIALQEVNQSAGAPLSEPSMLGGMISVPDCSIPVRSDNYAAWLAFALRQAGFDCSWAWLPVKLGYGRYDEGLALLSLNAAITGVDVLQLSRGCDYGNWKTRKALGVRLGGRDDWFYTVHMGRWDDEEEPFLHQWNALRTGAAGRSGAVWLMGDFNSPAEVRGEGYDCIRGDGWQDAWLLAGKTQGGATVEGAIDGWRDKVENPAQGMRIDHIWCSRPVEVRSARVTFDGRSEPKVSDHYGILLETGSETA